jgi:hypothetical protein
LYDRRAVFVAMDARAVESKDCLIFKELMRQGGEDG